LIESTDEMKEIAAKIETLQERLFHLNELANTNDRSIPILEKKIREGKEKESTIYDTLQILKERREKVFVIWKSIDGSLAANNKK
jgi:chromosome segregation ATPase